MGKSRDFRIDTISKMHNDLVDKNPDWDAFTNWLWDVFSFNKNLHSDLGNFDQYMARICEINDITSAKLTDIIANVHDVENTHTSQVASARTTLSDLIKKVRECSGDVSHETHVAFTLVPIMELFDISEEEAETIFDDPDKLSQALVALENLNYQNKDDPNYTPNGIHLSEEDMKRVLDRRAEIAAIGDPLYTSPDSYVSSLYGYRFEFSKDFHYGIDISAPQGSPIYSMWNGTVIDNGWNDHYGNYVIIQTEIDGVQYEMIFMHMQNPSGLLEGYKVVPGSEIGGVGNTANPLVGMHLHFELRTPGGDLYGWDRTQDPDKSFHVNPSAALNSYYDHPTITDVPTTKDGEVYYYDLDWSYAEELAGINSDRNEER